MNILAIIPKLTESEIQILAQLARVEPHLVGLLEREKALLLIRGDIVNPTKGCRCTGCILYAKLGGDKWC